MEMTPEEHQALIREIEGTLIDLWIQGRDLIMSHTEYTPEQISNMMDEFIELIRDDNRVIRTEMRNNPVNRDYLYSYIADYAALIPQRAAQALRIYRPVRSVETSPVLPMRRRLRAQNSPPDLGPRMTESIFLPHGIADATYQRQPLARRRPVSVRRQRPVPVPGPGPIALPPVPALESEYPVPTPRAPRIRPQPAPMVEEEDGRPSILRSPSPKRSRR